MTDSSPVAGEFRDRPAPTDKNGRKIFCVGFHKTGTKSLAAALELLGFRVCGTVGVHDPDIATKASQLIHSFVPRYDAFQDNPWPVFYRELDRCYPGSRFILTVRSADEWIDSAVCHFGTQDTPMRHYIYGAGHPEGNEELYVDRYRRHNDEVREYFRDRPDDLLTMNITCGAGWASLCTFLRVEWPSTPFPRLNTRGNRLRRGARR